MNSKKELRNSYKKLRQNLNLTDVEDLSIALANNLLKLNIWNFNNYHIFLSIEEQKEINTEYILNILAGKDKNIIISKSNFNDYSLTHYLLTDNTVLKKNNYNIPEPVDGLTLPDNVIDVVFVPLLAYDTKGNRIGYGKGFYDRFLKLCKPDVVKIGLSFFDPETIDFKTEQTDVTLDIVVTPKDIHTFN